ncbi:MAG: hypothetical protein HYY42_04385 [Chloroflexi bacterium]|nr:hypothetical protein [Chloroflexota bacterium]
MLIVLTQEPVGPVVIAAIVAIAVAVASAASLLMLRFATAGRSTRARSSRARALRRGGELGAIVGLIAALQVVGGLTPLKVLFIVLSFAIAEYVLSAGATPSR